MADWGNTTVRGVAASVAGLAAGLLASQVTGEPMGAGVAGLALAGILYSGGAFWWWNGFRFPESFTSTIRRGVSIEQGAGWAVDLTFENPGRTATFKVTYESVEGPDHPGATPGSPVNWRGHPGDFKEIARGCEPKLHLCDWPDRHSPPNPTGEYNAVTHSSTGQVVHTLARMSSPSEDVQREIRYRLSAFCKETEKTASYEIQVSGLNDAEPDVAVEKVGW